MASTLGDVHEWLASSNLNEIDDLARFAVEEHNKIEMASTLGGVHESRASSNSNDIDDLARFAVEEHNKKKFARVIKAQEQVVAGTLNHLTLEVIDAGKKKLYEAKVWVKPWMHFKELQEFKKTGDAPYLF